MNYLYNCIIVRNYACCAPRVRCVGWPDVSFEFVGGVWELAGEPSGAKESSCATRRTEVNRDVFRRPGASRLRRTKEPILLTGGRDLSRVALFERRQRRTIPLGAIFRF